jgi:phosphatidylserine decarboxylase
MAAGIIFSSAAGYLLAVLVFIIWVAGVGFFRDPERTISDNENLILAPADGVVRDIELISAADCGHLSGVFEGKDMLRIGIFLSVFDVHVNRAPCDMTVKLREHKDGMYLDARDPRAGKENESLILAGTAKAGGCEFPIGVKQISGAIARRIVCEAVPGDELKRGEQYGMIKYGSRTELYLPAKSDLLEIKVCVGDRVQGGLTVMAEFSGK